uniref:CCHC-type domain-containing protein n=1 Tax=Tanacetum cinerariifolium TaxID=118510 RepID=A0A6L2LC83_TANCI|nr:hypothetical protein [Tanacetum cinerariifolium]
MISASSSKTLDQTFDRLKKLISQLEIQGSSSTSQNPQNVAFVSFKSTHSTSRTNEADNTAFGVSTAHSQGNTVNSTSVDNLSDAVICSFLEMAMLTIKARRFIKRTCSNLDINGQKISFDMFKVECFNCHKNRHFARECRAPKNQENRGREYGRKTVPVENSTENALIAQDGIGGDVKIVESKHEYVDVKNKGVYNIVETKTVRKNNFSPPIIEDWNSDDESEVGKRKTAGSPVNTVRPVNIADSKPIVNNSRPISNVFKRGHSQVIRPYSKYSTYKKTIFNKMVNTVRVKDTTARERALVSEYIGREANAVKASACWVWKAKHSSASNSFKKYSYIDARGRSKSIMAWVSKRNKCYLTDYEDYDGGFIFSGDGKGRISGKSKIKTRTLDFDDVYFSDGFEQIVDFLNANPFKYALKVSPTIYTSCIKQFWTSAKVKTVNDDVRLQALVDGKKVIVNEESIRPPEEVGDIPTDTQDIPIITQPSSSQPQRKHKPKRKQREATEIPHTEPQAEERVPTPSHDPLPSGEDRLQLNEVMDICTKLSDRLEGKKKKKRTHGLKRLYKVGLSARIESYGDEEGLGAQEDASKQGRIAEIDANEDLFLIDETAQDQGRIKDQDLLRVHDLDGDEVFVDVTTGENVKQDATVAKSVEELKRCLEIVPEDVDDVEIEATLLSSKSPTIVDYKIYREGKKSYFKTSDENSQNYLTFRTMFKNFNREDLEVLKSIVNERFKKTKPVDDMDNLLFQTLKTMFEHHVKDIIWKYQQGAVKVNNWKLFDSCGVYCVTTKNMMYYLLVEKMYPFTNSILHQLWTYVRLQVDYDVEMAYDLLRLIRRHINEGFLGLVRCLRKSKLEMKDSIYSVDVLEARSSDHHQFKNPPPNISSWWKTNK